MSLTTDIPNPLKGSSSSSAIDRVKSYPIVSETSNFAGELINKLPLSQKLKPYVKSSFHKIDGAAKPIENRLSSQISTVNSYANKVLDKVEAYAPAIKSASSADLVKAASSAKEHSKEYVDKVASDSYSKVSNATEPVVSRVKRGKQSFNTIQAETSNYINDIPRNPKGFLSFVQQQIHSGVNKATSSVDHLTQYLVTKRDNVKSNISDTLKPYKDYVTNTAGEIIQEVKRKDAPIEDKAKSLIALTKGKLSDIVSNLYTKYVGLRNKGSAYGHDLYDKGHVITDAGKQEATQALSTVTSTVSDVTHFAKETLTDAVSDIADYSKNALSAAANNIEADALEFKQQIDKTKATPSNV